MESAVRLIDAGDVSALRSQALYHGLAYARAEDTPPTIVLARPAEPYVCVGFHQDAAVELDLEECAGRGLRVLRRETGGGAVYIDSDQLFVQWIFPPDTLPLRMDRRFAQFCRPLVATYREFGIDAEFVPANDVHVGGRKLVGTGAARIGASDVVVGNFLLDFDPTAMVRVVRLPWVDYREQVVAALDLYMTSMRRELPGPVPAPAEVLAAYCRHTGFALRPDEPTAVEQAAIERAERKLADPAFVLDGGGMRRPGLKIHQDVWVLVAAAESRRAVVRWHRGTIEDLVLVDASGPRPDLADRVRGIDLTTAAVQHALASDTEDDRAFTDLLRRLETKAPR